MALAVAIPKRSGKKAASNHAPSFYRFSVKQYHRLVELGILNDNDRVELLEGYIVDKMPQNPPHGAAIVRITKRMARVIPDEWLLRVQLPITFRTSEPEPDFAIVAGPEERYVVRIPIPRDVELFMEVADSSLLTDRRLKGPLFASAKIPQYWIINLVERKIEVYSHPRGGMKPAYRDRRDYGVGELVPLILGSREICLIAVRDLLPPEVPKARGS
jgi:Uma2 family endonuclease